MKIVYLSDDYPPTALGGAGKIASLMASELVSRGHEVHVVTTVQKKEDAGTFVEDRIEIHRLYSDYHPRWRAYVSLKNKQVLPEIQRIFAEIKPNVVHAHNIHIHLSYASLELARKYTSNVFLTLHDAMTVAYGKVWPRVSECGSGYRVSWLENIKTARKRFNPFRGFAIRSGLKSAKRIFVVSDALREVLEKSGVPNTETLHNGFDPVSARPGALDEAFLLKYGLIGKKVIFLPGRISTAKGAFAALSMMPIVVKKIPDAVLFFAGAGKEEQERIKKEALSLGIADHVSIAGWMGAGEIAKAYSSANVVIIPSLYLDPFPNVNLEAALHKKPLVVTCFGGSKEFVKDGSTGFVANPYDASAFADRIITLLSDSRKNIEMGQANYQRLLEEFTVQKQVDRAMEWYQKTGEGKG